MAGGLLADLINSMDAVLKPQFQIYFWIIALGD